VAGIACRPHLFSVMSKVDAEVKVMVSACPGRETKEYSVISPSKKRLPG